MRGMTHTPTSGRKPRHFAAIAAIVAATIMATGCSAGNLTGFDFPVFGLLKKDKDAKETAGPDNGAPSERKLDTL